MSLRWRSAVTALPRSGLRLGAPLEVGKAVVPHPCEVVPQRAQRETVGREEVARAVAALVHEPGLAQDLEVLGHGRSGDVEVRGDLAARTGRVPAPQGPARG